MKLCKKCQQPFEPIGSNHLYCGNFKDKTGCSWVNKQKIMSAYGAKYREAKKLGHWPNGRVLPATRKCLECKESFVVTTIRKIRCSACAPVYHNISLRKRYKIKRKCTLRPDGYKYQDKQCLFCEMMFPPSNGKVKYCSDKCAYEAQKIQVGEHQARVMQQNREAQRRQKDHIRHKPPTETILLPINLQDLTGGKLERAMKLLLTL